MAQPQGDAALGQPRRRDLLKHGLGGVGVAVWGLAGCSPPGGESGAAAPSGASAPVASGPPAMPTAPMAPPPAQPADRLAQALAHVQGGFVGPDPQHGHRLWTPLSARPSSPPPSVAFAAASPGAERRVRVLIAGGGVAGLSAARALRQAGVDDIALLELEDTPGGNARATQLQGLPCPTGAHYLPVPGPHNPGLQQLLAEVGLLHRDATGRWQPNDRHLCHSPQERLFRHGQWQPGLLPLHGVGDTTRAQYARWAALVAQARQTGRYQIPHVFSEPKNALAHDEWALDALLFSDFLTQNGLTDPDLRWYLDYCCRDEYGAGVDRVSAWAGVHYFAARHGFAWEGEAPADTASEGLFTWPEGNAWLTQRMAAPLGARLHTRRLVQRIAPPVGGPRTRGGVAVDVLNLHTGQTERWRADRVVVALPLHVAVRVVAPPPAWLAQAARAVRSAAWVVTNLHLSQPLADRGGAAPAWDSVVQGSAGLGVVNAQHQRLHPKPVGPQVLTHYRALGAGADVRQALLHQPWTHWLHTAVAELLPAHPELPQRLTHASVTRHGHGMAVPTPGLLRTLAACRPHLLGGGNGHSGGSPHLAYAHSDWAGYSVFEEAFALGHAAGQWAARRG